MKAKFSLAALLAMSVTAAHAATSPLDIISDNVASRGTVPMSMLNPRADVMASLKPGAVLALNQDSYVGGVKYSAASEFVVGAGGELYAVIPGQDDPVATGVQASEIPQSKYTLLQMDEKTGELLAFNIPSDFEVAGGGGHRRGRGGVTNCFHVAKAVLGRRIHLTGVAAASAAPQLQAAGWHRYDYASAPYGAACVFGAGGVHTSSGGQIYGHIGIKGRGGIIDPKAGFELHRPFLGCYAEA